MDNYNKESILSILNTTITYLNEQLKDVLVKKGKSKSRIESDQLYLKELKIRSNIELTKTLYENFKNGEIDKLI